MDIRIFFYSMGRALRGTATTTSVYRALFVRRRYDDDDDGLDRATTSIVVVVKHPFSSQTTHTAGRRISAFLQRDAVLAHCVLSSVCLSVCHSPS